MTAMLTEINLIPHRHFGLPGRLQKHMLVYTVVIAILLTAFFDLSRIASLGAIFYLTMDVILQWGVLKNLRKKVNVNIAIVITAILLDLLVLGAFLWIKASSDFLVIVVSIVLMFLVFVGERWFLQWKTNEKN